MLSSLSVMQRPSSEPNRPSLPLSLAAQEGPKIQTKKILRKRRARVRECSCLPPLRASHHGSDVKPPQLPMWTSWRRSAIFSVSLSRVTQHGSNPKQPAVDFFGRPIITPATDKNKPPSSRKQAKPYVVSFRFKVGNSAAVRKPVKMASFV